ncbi:hypothetical protein [Nitrosomonas communis]|uniref:Uncharacterized protein n=1 Tax=Nitrosomonas communis TaxID=44574 RepID=A0A1I4LS87_9PROT|nr:hypothetical protein [Nitrosomonas communis]SFL93958.1 hypothetical protein SAMN05421863_100774 [Nitrosomonas communis]
MNKNDQLTAADIAGLARRHSWAATGVSDYPPRDPLVGQSRFFKRYRTFIHTVDQDADNFAHVFAVEAEWGRGKSRLGHELIAQINDCSKGWFVREDGGQLEDKKLFDQATQDKYLALYIRYSQVASDYQNSDNWFGFGLYRALLPLATGKFDGSIQSKIAEQALHRLNPAGFDPKHLTQCLELDQAHSEGALYEEEGLVVRLVQAAYSYLQKIGIGYVLVVLDELETVAEAATFGLEQDDAKRLDGQAIRLIGKAIKEEDPRRKLPWLRYVALCSPLLGQQLREIQSVARRFELVELEHNAFADVSDYVAQLKAERKLAHDYPMGLVEAAYAMSGANFGWFNVVMANMDAVLAEYAAAGKQVTDLGVLFDAVVESSGRVAEHVLDKHAIEGIKTGDHDLRAVAQSLLYGQLPVALDAAPARCKELLQLANEDGEPVASLYRKMPFDALQCRQALEEAKFKRERDEWLYPAVEQALSLSALLQNLRTFAINEAEKDVLLLPLSRGEFKHLLSLLYDHPAVEFAADALWQKLIGSDQFVPDEEATHIGPSVAMLLRLDLRYRNQQHNSMIFRDPADADVHEAAMKTFLQASSHNPCLRWTARLMGLMRLLDKNWQYAQPSLSNKENLCIQASSRGQGTGQRGGLLYCEGLKLHPDNLAWFAWVNNRDELDRLHQLAATRHTNEGRFPVMAFTASTHLMEQYNRGDVSEKLKDDLLLYYLNPSEVDQLERIGLTPEQCKGFSLDEARLTSKFKNKLNALRDFAYQAIHQWRARLNERGLIAWPLRPTGKINTQDRDLLLQAWTLFVFKKPTLSGLNDLETRHGIDAEEIASLMQRLALPSKLLSLGFAKEEHAGLFADLANPQQAQAKFPYFLARIANPVSTQEWTLEKAKRGWYWGYLQHASVTAKNVFDDWMWWCGELHLLQLQDATATTAKWQSLPRAKLDNAINEAQNWFNGNSADGYKAVVAKLERVFGYDRIPGLFAPLGKSPTGTETVEAHELIKAARSAFDALKVNEEALALQGADALAAITDKMPALLAGRFEVLQRVAGVKPEQVPEITLGNINTLRLDDKSLSLYQRIEQARLFADYVEKAASQIKQGINHLITDIEADAQNLDMFPRSLFTLSLQTVNNILDGALQQRNESDTATAEGTASSDTLLHYLRSLQLDKAADRLRLLAEEAGVNIDNGTALGLTENLGHIASSYRVGKKKFVEITGYLAELKARCAEAARVLEPMPAGYTTPEHTQELAALAQKLVLIGDAFEDLADLAKSEREKFREQARKGQFSAIRGIPDRLLNPIHSQLHSVGGAISKVENTILSHRETLVSQTNERYLPVLTPLFGACNETVPAAINLASVSALSLHDLQITIDMQQSQWENKANQLLSGTGLDFASWQDLATAIAEGKNPALSPPAQEALVAKGILRMKLYFGGNA